MFEDVAAVYVPFDVLAEVPDPEAWLDDAAGIAARIERDVQFGGHLNVPTPVPTTTEDLDHTFLGEFQPPGGTSTQEAIAAWHIRTVADVPLFRRGNGEGALVAVLDSGYDPIDSTVADAVSDSMVAHVDLGPVPYDDTGHGTATIGLIAARPKPLAVGNYYWSVAPGAKVFSAKVLDRQNSGTGVSILMGLIAAYYEGADVINMSFGRAAQFGGPLTVMERVIDILSTDRVLIAAAGNNAGRDSVEFPAAYPGVVAVGAIDRTGKAWWNNPTSSGTLDKSTTIEVVAPGVGVLTNDWSSVGSGELAPATGSSCAAALVTGVAAVLVGVGLISNTQDLRDALRSGNAVFGGARPWHRDEGFGLIYLD